MFESLRNLLRINRPRVEIHRQRDIAFVGAQDGIVEREIKARWTLILAQYAAVQRAYLAIVSYDRASTPWRALCIRSSAGHDRRLAEVLAEPFRRTFNASVAVDVMFVDDDQEIELQKVCRPFYRAFASTEPE